MARKTPNSHSMISKAAAVAIPPHQPADRGQVTLDGTHPTRQSLIITHQDWSTPAISVAPRWVRAPDRA